MHASVNVVCQGKSSPGKIHEVILVSIFYKFGSRVIYFSLGPSYMVSGTRDNPSPEVTLGAFTRHSFWVRHSKILARGPIGLGTVRLIYTTKYVRVFSVLISRTAPLKQERHS